MTANERYRALECARMRLDRYATQRDVCLNHLAREDYSPESAWWEPLLFQLSGCAENNEHIDTLARMAVEE